MNKSKIFLFLSLSFIFGVSLRSFWSGDLKFWADILVIAAIMILAIFYQNKKAAVAAFCIIFLAGGIWRTEIRLDEMKNINLENKSFSGNVIVSKEPEQKENYQKLILKKQADGMSILVNADLYPEIKYGDELKVSCILQVPDNKDAGFDYRMYLAKDRIYYLCPKAQIEKTGKNKGDKFYGFIINLKNRMSVNINKVIPYPYSSLGNGLIFGGSSDFPSRLKENFSRTGVTHIIAVSGYNVTIVAEYLILFGIWIGLWRKQAFWFALSGIIIFVAMTGFPSSAVRAGVMGGILLWAMKNGRLANAWNAIVLAAAVMLLFNPLLLRWDIGFQLSFLATIGIVTLSPFWENYLLKKYRAAGLAEIFLLTLSAQFFVLPIIIYNFHAVSLVSLAANMLILPIIPLSMLLVFLTALSGFIFLPISQVFSWITFLPLKYEIVAINYLAGFHWASAEIKNFNTGCLIGWYVMLGSITYYSKKIKLKPGPELKDFPG
jgi:competence protein ComEC